MTEFIRRAQVGISYWKMAWLRVTLYAGIVSWGVFTAGVEGYKSLAEMDQISLWKLFGNMAVAAAGVIVAFLDSTMQNLRQGRPDLDTNEKPTP